MEGILYLLSPPPAPSHAYSFLKERTAQAREGENIQYISFQRGRCPLWNPSCGKPGLSGSLQGVRGGSWCPVGTAQDRPRRQPRPEPRLVEGLQGDTSPCGGIQRGACPPFEEMTRENYPHARLTRRLPPGHGPCHALPRRRIPCSKGTRSPKSTEKREFTWQKRSPAWPAACTRP